MPWISPTGYRDEIGEWHNETYAYDDNVNSAAYSDDIDEGSWGEFLELIIGPYIACKKLRFNVSYDEDYIALIDIDIRSGDTWYHIYEGDIGYDHQWVEKVLSHVYPSVSKVRMKFYNNSGEDTENAEIWEFDFGTYIPVKSQIHRRRRVA